MFFLRLSGISGLRCWIDFLRSCGTIENSKFIQQWSARRIYIKWLLLIHRYAILFTLGMLKHGIKNKDLLILPHRPKQSFWFRSFQFFFQSWTNTPQFLLFPISSYHYLFFERHVWYEIVPRTPQNSILVRSNLRRFRFCIRPRKQVFGPAFPLFLNKNIH